MEVVLTVDDFPLLRLNGGDYNKDPLRPLIENIGGMIMMAIPLGSS